MLENELRVYGRNRWLKFTPLSATVISSLTEKVSRCSHSDHDNALVWKCPWQMVPARVSTAVWEVSFCPSAPNLTSKSTRRRKVLDTSLIGIPDLITNEIPATATHPN